MTATLIDVAPPEAFGPSRRKFPLRKPNGFVPQVQRWSFLLPAGCEQMRVGFFAVQGKDADAIANSAFRPSACTHQRLLRTSTGMSSM